MTSNGTENGLRRRVKGLSRAEFCARFGYSERRWHGHESQSYARIGSMTVLYRRTDDENLEPTNIGPLTPIRDKDG